MYFSDVITSIILPCTPQEAIERDAEEKCHHLLLNFAISLLLVAGTVKVWDPRQKDDPVANMEPVQGENKRDCWTVAFGKLFKTPCI